MPPSRAVALLALEPVAGELQRPAVFGHCADNLIRGAIRDGRFDLEGDRDLRAHLPDKMRDHLFGDAARIASNARRIELYGAMEPAESWGRGRTGRPRLRRAGDTGGR